MCLRTPVVYNDYERDPNNSTGWVGLHLLWKSVCLLPTSAVEENRDKTIWLTMTWSISDKPVKVDRWDGTALKNALDDATKKVFLERFEYVESHKLMDGRLLICTFAVGFALFALVWDYIRPFPESRPILIMCVLLYFLLMAVLTFYTTYKEKGIFLIALDKDKAGFDPDNIWTVSSFLKKYDDIYYLIITFKDGSTKRTRHAEFKKSVECFFCENGELCFDFYESEVRKLHTSLSTQKKGK